MELAGSTPASTAMGFQYRVSNSETGVASETWKPVDTLNPANLAVRALVTILFRALQQAITV